MRRMRYLILCFGLLAAVLAANAAAAGRVRVGKITDISSNLMELKEAETGEIGSWGQIPFTADERAVAELAKIEIGQEVRVVLGSVPGMKDWNLVSIRPCRPGEEECRQIRSKNQAWLARSLRESAASDRRDSACRRAMDRSLRKDFPGATGLSARRLQQPERLQAINALSDEPRACFDRFAKRYESAYLRTCELHHCGDNVGGGCHHLAGYAIQDIYDSALHKCSAPASEPSKP